MKALTCEMCGSTNLVKDGGVFVCQSCGTKYSVEEAKKMMIDGVVSVKVDVSDELKNLYEVARRAKDSNNSENAHKYYDMILIKDPNSWEATFYVTYYQAMQCKIAEINSAACSISNCEESVLDLIKTYVAKEEQNNVLIEIYTKLMSISYMLFNAAKNHYESIDSQIQLDYLQEYIYNASASAEIMYTFGNLVISKFGDEYGNTAVLAWKDGIEIHKEYVKYLQDKDGNINIIEEYAGKIKKFDSTYERPQVQTSGCYIATAVYGSYDCPEVWTLRRFRDYTLAETWYGRLFIKAYYAISPTLVKHFGNSIWFKKLFASPINKLVKHLKNKGVECTPYKDKIFK